VIDFVRRFFGGMSLSSEDSNRFGQITRTGGNRVNHLMPSWKIDFCLHALK